MKRLVKFLQLTWSDRFLLVTTAFLLGAIRLALWLLPFQIVRHLLARITQPTTQLQEADQTYIDRVVWAVAVASWYIPGAKCLHKALGTQVLFYWHKYPACLQIGVAKDEGGQLLAHAWVESQGKVVIGNLANLSDFTSLSLLGGKNTHEFN